MGKVIEFPIIKKVEEDLDLLDALEFFGFSTKEELEENLEELRKEGYLI